MIGINSDVWEVHSHFLILFWSQVFKVSIKAQTMFPTGSMVKKMREIDPIVNDRFSIMLNWPHFLWHSV